MRVPPRRVGGDLSFFSLLHLPSGVLRIDVFAVVLFVRREHQFLAELGLASRNHGSFTYGAWGDSGPDVASTNPTNNQASARDYKEGMRACYDAAKTWMTIPAPKRGDIVRQISDALRAKLHHLGRLVSLEMGKILQKGIGEV
ncbi:hypothetical protein ABZP36_021891 [Zizania latifolia]